MEVKRVVAGVYAANCYLVYKDDRGFVIDPGGHADKIIKNIEEIGFSPEFILLTHGHCDHIAGAEELRDKYNIPILIHQEDAKMLVDKDLSLASSMPSANVAFEADGTFKDGDILYEDDFNVEVIHTPGHTAGCSCFIVDDDLFTGDTLFAGNIGRTDLPTASSQDMKDSLKKIRSLDDDLIVHPGHGAESTMKNEKKINPYLQL